MPQGKQTSPVSAFEVGLSEGWQMEPAGPSSCLLGGSWEPFFFFFRLFLKEQF